MPGYLRLERCYAPPMSTRSVILIQALCLTSCIGTGLPAPSDGGTPDLAGVACTSAAGCPVSAICQVCPDGSCLAPTAACVAGRCVVTQPVCPTSACSGGCPQPHDCMMCCGGATVCATASCVNGMCVTSFPSCPGPAPCTLDGGLSCNPSGLVVSLNATVTNDCHLAPKGDVSMVQGQLQITNTGCKDLIVKIVCGSFIDAATGGALATFCYTGSDIPVAAGQTTSAMIMNEPGTLQPSSSCAAIPCSRKLEVTVDYDTGIYPRATVTSQPFALPCTP